MSASAPAVNQVTLVGNLTVDPVVKRLDEDRKVCQLRVAVNDVKDQPVFIDVATFGAQAEACAKYLTKGRVVAVTGRLVYREWDENGTRCSRHHVVGRVQFGGKPDEPTTSTDISEEAESFNHLRPAGSARPALALAAAPPTTASRWTPTSAPPASAISTRACCVPERHAAAVRR